MTVQDLEITHTDKGSSGEYVAHVPGSDAVGRLTWNARGDDVRVADHTLVPPEIGGRGVAAALVERLITDARDQGFKIVPQCSYVADKFSKNPEWSDLKA